MNIFKMEREEKRNNDKISKQTKVKEDRYKTSSICQYVRHLQYVRIHFVISNNDHNMEADSFYVFLQFSINLSLNTFLNIFKELHNLIFESSPFHIVTPANVKHLCLAFVLVFLFSASTPKIIFSISFVKHLLDTIWKHVVIDFIHKLGNFKINQFFEFKTFRVYK